MSEYPSAPVGYYGKMGNAQNAISTAPEMTLYDNILRLDHFNARLLEMISVAFRINGIIGGLPPYGNPEDKTVPDENGHIARMFQKVSGIEEKLTILSKQLDRSVALLGSSNTR